MASISDIPDELLLNILSSLPSKEVVATSVLSKRWRSLWTEVKTFRYDGESIGRTYWKFVLFISKRSSVETMQLKLNPHCTHRDIKPLINIAVARSLRELRIEMICESFELPKSFYMFSQLETVILEKVSLKDVPRNAHLPCLKRLHLLSVKFTGDESVKKLLSICPILEELVVKRSSLTNVMIYTIDAPLLRILSIEFENMPQLVKARVNVVCDEPDKFLGSLASTQYLSLCSVTSETPDSYLPIGTSFVFLDHLELCLCSTEWWNLLTCILVDAPKLRVLKLKLYRKHCVRYNEAMDQWNQPDYVPMCLSSYLEIFEWRQYNGKEKEREVAKYILANASRLKKATFYSESGEKHGILKELEYMARGSKTCKLLFD
ncbi:FBD domain [Arabidopsis thaliana x Arabidopsis arenosa]|uniref:FBD domain n=1 Tax=Arabidopsis thaliana x Arabidopsis arenosa TaxID=1240361 RepID=A0A8T2CHW5_9BRAS|nr:FBD domain [Arabidopsis thaliana x Arabidopsis arenosa]